ncbi:MAG: hypothetical protein ACSHWW_08560 [Nonlabens sp.]|uniref:hypothetical protein n=1 Tax=Nonlabens sp. TaxID=1888209 RepID=UPI003EF0EC5F
MKNVFFLLLCIVFTSLTVSGQTYVDDTQVINNDNLRTANAQLNVASVQNNTVATTQFVNQNSVFIEQVGSGNNAIINVASDDSQINLYQNGALNMTTLNLSADRIRANIVQIGNSNSVYDYSVHGAQTHNINVLQNGDYNTTISAGANGISEKMTISQTGIGSSVYVLSF